MTELTQDDFTAAMVKAVEIRGADYVYPKHLPGWTTDGSTCVYSTPEGEPACLIGLAISLIDPDRVPTYEDSVLEDATSADNVLRAWQLGASNFFETENMRIAAYRAQEAQDNGGTWGEALDVYLKNLEDYA